MRIVDKISKALSDQARPLVDLAMKEKFGIETRTCWDFFSDKLVTDRVDGQNFTPKQFAYLAGFSEGYAAAMGVVAMEGKG